MPFSLNNSGNLLARPIASCSRAMTQRRGKSKRKRGYQKQKCAFLIKHNTGLANVQHTHVHGRVPTCSLTEARMEEVVSVSDLSPLEAGITGATMAPFSCSAGCSGTGIADMNTHTRTQRRNMVKLPAVIEVQKRGK